MPGGNARTISVNLPVPRGGVNYIDGPDAPESRDITDARTLKNLYPSGATVDLRGGIDAFITITGGDPVNSLFNLILATGADRLVAATDNKLYRIDTGSASNITGATTPTSDNWQGTIFSHYLFLCNGADTMQRYDGTNVIDSTFTGPTLSTLINASSYHERLMFVQKDTASYWVSAVQAVGASALTEVPLKYVLKSGGFLVWCGSHTHHSGQLPTDLFVAVSSEGEVLFYQGSDPTSASNWAIAARYYVGKPMGYNAFIEVDNDTWMITEAGIVPLSLLFGNGSTVAVNAVSRKVNMLIQRYAKSVGFSPLWRGMYWPQGKRVFVQVPKSASQTFMLVCNIETGAWCVYEYNSVSGFSMALMDGVPYIGSSTGGIVYEAEQDQSDDGLAISWSMDLPFTFFGDRQSFKVFKDVRPLMFTERGVSVGFAINTDFRDDAEVSTVPTGSGTNIAWDVSDWDTSDWGTEGEYIFDRYSLRGQGHCGSLKVEGSCRDVVLKFTSFDVRMELGGQV